jgi:hypothetical protein
MNGSSVPSGGGCGAAEWGRRGLPTSWLSGGRRRRHCLASWGRGGPEDRGGGEDQDKEASVFFLPE